MVQTTLQEWLGKLKRLSGKGLSHLFAAGGYGGTYCFKNCKGEPVAVVKPTDEEPGALNNPKNVTVGLPGIKVGQSAWREVAAYLLDCDYQSAKVPITAFIEISHWAFNMNNDSNEMRRWNKEDVKKTASVREYIPHLSSVDHHREYAAYPQSCVHRIGILDIRTLNLDRCEASILVRVLEGQTELIPVDHGQCLPEVFHKTSFAWHHWPQASQPFTADELEYIKNLKPCEDADMLKKAFPLMPESSLRILVVCTTFLQEAAHRKFCLKEMADMMERAIERDGELFSDLQLVCLDLIREVQETETSIGFGDLTEEAWSSFMDGFPDALENSMHFQFKNYRSST